MNGISLHRYLVPTYWEDVATPCSISWMMERLCDKDIWTIEVFIGDPRSTHIIMTAKHGSMSCKKMFIGGWEAVHHMIQTRPTNCDCWCCEWRLKRDRYCDLDAYKHLK